MGERPEFFKEGRVSIIFSCHTGWEYNNFMENPFGFNLEHDLNLVELLELNICFLTIQQQSLSQHRPPQQQTFKQKLWNLKEGYPLHEWDRTYCQALVVDFHGGRL